MDTKVCEACGKTFHRPRRSKQSGFEGLKRWSKRRVCSRVCYGVLIRKAPPKPPLPLSATCKNPECGVVFVPQRRDRMYCSKKCNRRSRTIRTRSSRVLIKRVCQRCQVVFETSFQGIKKYCSLLCKRRAMGNRWYYANKDKAKAARAVYYAKQGDYIKAKCAEYRERTKEQRRAKAKQYYAANREKWINHKLVRRAREAASRDEMAKCLAYIKMVRSKRFKTCYYCKQKFTCNPHFDHVIPLSKGGKHEVGNLCVSCPKCNFTKSALLPSQLRMPQLVLSL